MLFSHYFTALCFLRHGYIQPELMTDTKRTPAVGDSNVIGALKRCGSVSFQSIDDVIKKQAVEKQKSLLNETSNESAFL